VAVEEKGQVCSGGPATRFKYSSLRLDEAGPLL
jgi:hypothetical protein